MVEAAQTYVVQRMDTVEVVVASESQDAPDLASQIKIGPKLITEKRDYWVDIRTVTVPPRTKRATVIQTALTEAGIVPDPKADPLRLRAIDAANAEAIVFGAKPPAAPEWEVKS